MPLEKVDGVSDFSSRGLGELKAWLEPWFHNRSEGNGTTGGGTSTGIDFNIEDISQDATGADARFLSLETVEDSELVMKTRLSDGLATHAAYKFIAAAVGGFNVRLSNDSSFLLEQNGSALPGDFVDTRVGDIYLVGSGSPFAIDPAPADYAAYQIVNNSDANFEILNTGSGTLSLHNSNGAILVDTGGGDLILGSTNIGRIVMISDQLIISGLPTSSPGGSGRVWNSAGTLKIT